jgi:Uma2 family endonuclease
MSQSASKLKITPADNGRQMSLSDFEDAEVQEGYTYELSRGVIVVSEVPNPWHAVMIDAIRRQIEKYRIAHPDIIKVLPAGNECKVLLSQLASERHPDIAAYLTMPPASDSTVWRIWIPEIVIEVVSPGSEERDYNDKREEYLQFGVKEYWIFNRERQELLALIRSRGAWEERVVRTPAKYQSAQLPGFEMDCEAVFVAGR